ncbi:hypothetical protein D3C86_1510400 [compost metagenome]
MIYEVAGSKVIGVNFALLPLMAALVPANVATGAVWPFLYNFTLPAPPAILAEKVTLIESVLGSTLAP